MGCLLGMRGSDHTDEESPGQVWGCMCPKETDPLGVGREGQQN